MRLGQRPPSATSLLSEDLLEHPVYTALPIGQVQGESGPQLAGIQARVGGPWRRQRIGTGRHRLDGFRGNANRLPGSSRLLDDMSRVAMPTGLAAGSQVIETGEFGALASAANRMCGDIGEEFGAGRRTDLVRDDA